MATMFSKLVSIVGELAGSEVNEGVSSSAAFLEKHSEDFFEKDREVIERETFSGDKYIWAVKGCGSGTILEHVSDLSAEAKICSSHANSKFYLLTFTDRNQGSIDEITQSKALDIANKNRGFFENTPVRQEIIQGISRTTGIDELSLQEMGLFKNVLSPSPNEDIYLKFSYDSKMQKIIVDMAKPKLKEYTAGKIKHGMFLFSSKHRDIKESMKTKDLFIKIKPCDNASKGKFYEIPKEEFEKADSSAKKNKISEAEIAMAF